MAKLFKNLKLCCEKKAWDRVVMGFGLMCNETPVSAGHIQCPLSRDETIAAFRCSGYVDSIFSVVPFSRFFSMKLKMLPLVFVDFIIFSV